MFDSDSFNSPCDAIRISDDELLRFAHGRPGEFADEIDLALDYLRAQIGIQDPQLDASPAIPAFPTRDAAGQRSPEEIYGIGVLLLEGNGWKIDSQARNKLLQILGKSENDVISVYVVD